MMWWSEMSTLQQAAFIIACAATLILIVQIILMFVGASGSHDVSDVSGGASDLDVSGAGDGDFSGAGEIDADVPDIDACPVCGSDLSGSGDAISGDGDFDDLSTDGDGDASGSLEGHGKGFAPFGFKLLSIRSILAFFAIGAWVLYTACYGLEWYYALLVALACGLIAACGMAGAMLGMEKLQSSGNIDIKNAVGKIGSVYLTVPPSRGGTGKVTVLVQERYTEYNAVTDGDEPLPTASEIKVVGIVGSNVLLVQKYKKPSIVIENK